MLETCLFPLQNRFLLLADFFFFPLPLKGQTLLKLTLLRKQQPKTNTITMLDPPGSTIWRVSCSKAELSSLFFCKFERQKAFRFGGFHTTAGLRLEGVSFSSIKASL